MVILDDVFAELDQARRGRLAEAVAGFEQVLITAAVEDVPEHLAANAVHIRAGEIVGECPHGRGDTSRTRRSTSGRRLSLRLPRCSARRGIAVDARRRRGREKAAYGRSRTGSRPAGEGDVMDWVTGALGWRPRCPRPSSPPRGGRSPVRRPPGTPRWRASRTASCSGRCESTAWATQLGVDAFGDRRRASPRASPTPASRASASGAERPSWKHGRRSIPGRGRRCLRLPEVNRSPPAENERQRGE